MKPVPFSTRALAFATQYSEVKQRALSARPLLDGTPGFLKAKVINGSVQVYRVYQDGAGKRVEAYVGPGTASDKIDAMQSRVDEARWIQGQTSKLRLLGFQVADKAVAEVLIAFSNQGLFDAGLVLVGTLAVMSWINEMGLESVASMTRDIDFARPHRIKLAAPLSFVDVVKSTNLGFTPVPGMPSHAPSTSLKRKGVEGLKVDLLAPGSTLGRQVKIPELDWTADTIPHYDWLLEMTDRTCVLAGGHCVPVRVPDASRLALHKFYSSTQRHAFQDKAAKDRQQGTVLAAALADANPVAFADSYRSMPSSMRRRVDRVIDRAAFGTAAGLVEEMLANARD